MLLAGASAPALTAQECRVTITHFGDGAARHAPLTTVAVLTVGDVMRQELDWLGSVRNEGAHDIRIELAGATSRELSANRSDPVQGRYAQRVRLLRLECLPTRTVR
ncbi:MAG: hypothetical protein ACK4V1_02425 [Burkholderiaceae bacterium]